VPEFGGLLDPSVNTAMGAAGARVAVRGWPVERIYHNLHDR
jgi:hypothetical protein